MKPAPFSIGTDEAGYGPNLGPLLIAGTVWQREDAKRQPRVLIRDRQAWGQLSKAEKQQHVLVADSKQVYQSGKIELLERGVLCYLYAVAGTVPRSLEELAKWVGLPDSVFDQPGFGSEAVMRELALPLAADVDLIERLGSELVAGTSTRLVGVKCRAMFAGEFNDQCDRVGNKASVLSSETLGLINQLHDQYLPEDFQRLDVRCDKHGGRSRYAGLLHENLDICESYPVILEEGRPLSCYQIPDSNVEISFAARGESWLSIALASMFAKYLREIFMLGWNRFWATKVSFPLRPTKGYPVDAKRFFREIESAMKTQKMDVRSIWRGR